MSHETYKIQPFKDKMSRNFKDFQKKENTLNLVKLQKSFDLDKFQPAGSTKHV
jgi:hypothetical protein